MPWAPRYPVSLGRCCVRDEVEIQSIARSDAFGGAVFGGARRHRLACTPWFLVLPTCSDVGRKHHQASVHQSGSHVYEVCHDLGVVGTHQSAKLWVLRGDACIIYLSARRSECARGYRGVSLVLVASMRLNITLMFSLLYSCIFTTLAVPSQNPESTLAFCR